MSKKEGKSIWGKIASTFVETEAPKGAEPAEEVAAATVAPTAPATTSFNIGSPDTLAANPVATVPTAQMTGQFNQEIYNGLLELLAEHDLDGIDYLEFTKTKKSFEGMTGLTEQQKVVAAFNAVKAQSTEVTKDTILTTADHYIKVLAQEQANFDAEMDTQMEAEVTSKRESAVQKQEQIAELQAEIQTLNAESAEAETKIMSVKSNFEATIKVVQIGIDTDKSNITQFVVEQTPTV